MIVLIIFILSFIASLGSWRKFESVLSYFQIGLFVLLIAGHFKIVSFGFLENINTFTTYLLLLDLIMKFSSAKKNIRLWHQSLISCCILSVVDFSYLWISLFLLHALTLILLSKKVSNNQFSQFIFWVVAGVLLLLTQISANFFTSLDIILKHLFVILLLVPVFLVLFSSVTHQRISMFMIVPLYLYFIVLQLNYLDVGIYLNYYFIYGFILFVFSCLLILKLFSVDILVAFLLLFSSVFISLHSKTIQPILQCFVLIQVVFFLEISKHAKLQTRNSNVSKVLLSVTGLYIIANLLGRSFLIATFDASFFLLITLISICFFIERILRRSHLIGNYKTIGILVSLFIFAVTLRMDF